MHEYELFEYYPVTGYEITSAADKGKDGLTAIEDIQGDVNSKHKTALEAVEDDIEPYVGSATQSTDSQVSNMKQTVTYADGALRMFALAVDNYNMNSGPGFDDQGTPQSPRSVSKLNQCYSHHANDSFGLDYDDYKDGGSKESRDYGTDFANASGALKGTLQTEFGWLGGNLDDKATEVEGILNRGPNEKDLRAMYAAGALPSWVASVYPQYDFSGISFTKLPSDLAAMTPDQLADYLLAHPKLDPNIMLNLDILAPGVVDIMGGKLADKIRNADISWDTDEDVLQRYASLLQTWQDSSLAVTASMYEKLGAKGALQFLDKLGSIAYHGTHDDADNLASTFRRGLGLADAMWDNQQRAQYGQDLGQALEDNRRDYPPGAFESSLSYLLKEQYYSAALLNPLGDKLADMDFGANSWCNDGSNLIHDKDLMTSFFSSLAHNDEAGKHFFGQDGRVDQYFEREGADPFYYNSLGDALETATTENPDQTSADIVGDLVHHVGSKDNNQETFSGHDLMNPELRDDMANIMKTWIASVHDSMVPGQPFSGPGADGDWDPVTPGKQEFGVKFDQRELAYFLGDLGKDDGAHDTVVAAEHTYSAAAYDHYMSDRDLSAQERALQAQRVANPTGTVLGALDFGATTQAHETTAAADKAHNDRVDAAFTVADSLVGLVPTGKVPLAGDAINFMMGELQDSLQQDTSGVGNYNAGDVYDGGQSSAEAIAQAAYYRNTPDAELPTELHGHPPVSQWTAAQKAAYVDWLQDTGMSPAASNSATGAAHSAYSNGYSDAQNMIQGK